MKQDCLLCQRSSPDNNLYCQEVYCPAEMSPTILDHGEWLGNIEIVKAIIVLRTSVLYEARYQKKRVLLKVAHPGPENRERLKREAIFLQGVQNKKESFEHMPRLLAPYANTTVEREPYGKVVLRDHLLYYCLFEHFDGETLRDILTKNLQMWVYHIGWIMTNLADAVAVLQSKGMLHFGISPDVVLVRLDDESGAPGILLFDLGVASTPETLKKDWSPSFVHPAYTANELIGVTSPEPSYATDVYGLGLTLYELLVGEPPYAYKSFSDIQVYENVRNGRRVDMTRSEDVGPAAQIALRAVNSDVNKRFANAAEMAKELLGAFGEAPEKKSRLGMKLALLIGAALMTVIILVVLVLIPV